MKYVQESEEIDKIKKNLNKICCNIINNNIKDILIQVADDYKIPLDELLKKYYNENIILKDIKKTKKNNILKCIAKTNRGTQCSSAKLEGQKYCSKHITTQKYGDYDVDLKDEI